jgi:cell division transport system ATP-binding protein
MDTIVDLRAVSVFQQNKLIIANMNLQVSKGDLIYLIGRVGSGKSSILKTLYADLPLITGEGNVAGFDLRALKERKIPYLRRKLGIVFQDFQLLTDRNVFENLAFVLKATGWKKPLQIQERIGEVLNWIGLSEKAYAMPHQLSGGEQQRVVIARALLNDPEVILADEPTGNLDPASSAEILELLIRISRTGRAVIIATHDYAIIEKFPSTIYLCQDTQFREISISDLTLTAGRGREGSDHFNNQPDDGIL